jgi:hypothetical protein
MITSGDIYGQSNSSIAASARKAAYGEQNPWLLLLLILKLISMTTTSPVKREDSPNGDMHHSFAPKSLAFPDMHILMPGAGRQPHFLKL